MRLLQGLARWVLRGRRCERCSRPAQRLPFPFNPSLHISQLPSPRTFPSQQVPVVEGAHKSLRGAAKERIADFVHGRDGFGNTNPPLAQARTAQRARAVCFACGCGVAAAAVELAGHTLVCAASASAASCVRASQGPLAHAAAHARLPPSAACLLPPQAAAAPGSAAEFIVGMAGRHPGQVVVLALAALTNVALALHLDPQLPEKLVGVLRVYCVRVRVYCVCVGGWVRVGGLWRGVSVWQGGADLAMAAVWATPDAERDRGGRWVAARLFLPAAVPGLPAGARGRPGRRLPLQRQCQPGGGGQHLRGP